MKTYKGYELIKEIAEGNIKDGTRFEFKSTIAIAKKEVRIERKSEGYFLIDIDTDNPISTGWLLNSKIILIEDEIDIQDIKKLESYSEEGVGLYDKNSIHFNRLKINELIKTVNKMNKTIKQLNNKINK